MESCTVAHLAVLALPLARIILFACHAIAITEELAQLQEFANVKLDL